MGLDNGYFSQNDGFTLFTQISEETNSEDKSRKRKREEEQESDPKETGMSKPYYLWYLCFMPKPLSYCWL